MCRNEKKSNQNHDLCRTMTKCLQIKNKFSFWFLKVQVQF